MVWEKEVEEFIKPRIQGYSLNIPCGQSQLGDIKIDNDINSSADRIADMMSIPYPNNYFDTVISDPPWKLNHFKRPKQFFELVRVCKVGGTIIFNATWIPESKCVRLDEIWVRQSARFGNVSIICLFTKTKTIASLKK